MPAQIFNDGNFQAIGNDGKVVPYGKLYVRDHYSGLDVVTYQDSEATIPNVTPVVMTASGKGKVFLPLGVYDIELHTQTDVIVWTLENFISTAFTNDEVFAAAQQTAIDTSRSEAAVEQAYTHELNSAAYALTCAAYANMEWGGFTVVDGELVVTYADGAVSTPSLDDGDFIITY